ncbi:MAG TPA: metallophosphoesterase [Planctomycetota bacterium]|nr:metallophosphoesterase [Planctomycetota bacterium]
MRRLAHLSDLHFDVVAPDVVEGAVADVAAARVDLVVVSGDLTQRARRRQFAAAKAFVDRLPTPRLIVPGNHDVPLFNLLRRVTDPFDRYEEAFGADREPWFADEELAVQGLSTVRPLRWKEGRVTDGQRERVLRAFAGERRFKIVVMHHPLMPPERRDDRRSSHDAAHGAAQATRAFHDAGVDLVLSGHVHAASRTATHAYRVDDRTVLVVQAGTATSRRTRGEPNHWNLIVIDGGNVRVESRHWNGARFEATSAEEFRREEGRWRRAGFYAPPPAEGVPTGAASRDAD